MGIRSLIAQKITFRKQITIRKTWLTFAFGQCIFFSRKVTLQPQAPAHYCPPEAVEQMAFVGMILYLWSLLANCCFPHVLIMFANCCFMPLCQNTAGQFVGVERFRSLEKPLALCFASLFVWRLFHPLLSHMASEVIIRIRNDKLMSG